MYGRGRWQQMRIGVFREWVFESVANSLTVTEVEELLDCTLVGMESGWSPTVLESKSDFIG